MVSLFTRRHRDNYQKVVEPWRRLDVAHLYITDGQLVKGEGGQWKPEVNPYQNPPSEWLMPSHYRMGQRLP